VDAELRFRAMGCDVHVLIGGGRPDLLETTRELIGDLERRWSRFRDDSEISLLNRRAGRPVRVSRQTVELVGHALEGARVTAGRYDPTVLGAVLRAGYDRSFELLGPFRGASGAPEGRPAAASPGARRTPPGRRSISAGRASWSTRCSRR
jgi:thiamine biosynthesis lipoprotein